MSQIRSLSTFVTSLRFYVGVISQPVTVTVYRDDQTGKFKATYSHELIPPGIQTESEYVFDRDRDLDDVKRKIVGNFDRIYGEALDSGLVPDDSWMVRNERL